MKISFQGVDNIPAFTASFNPVLGYRLLHIKKEDRILDCGNPSCSRTFTEFRGKKYCNTQCAKEHEKLKKEIV